MDALCYTTARMSEGKPSSGPQVVAHNLLLRSELERISAAFRRENLAWLVLKGLPLAITVYGGLSERYCVDNDILVRRTDVATATRLLRTLGYESAARRTLRDDLAANFQHPMRRESVGGLVMRVEVHWNAFPPHLYDVPEALLWRRTETCSLGTCEVATFGPEMTLVHLASHFVQHRCAEPRILTDLGKAASVWRDTVDTVLLEQLAATTGTRAALAFGLGAAWRLGLTSVPPLLDDVLATRLLDFVGATALRRASTPSYTQMAWSLLLAAPGRRLHALWRELVPPASVLVRAGWATEEGSSGRVRYVRRMLRPLVAARPRRSR